MGIDFYYYPMGAPCRAVRMAAQAFGIQLNLKQVNIMEGEQMNPDYLKMNPRHTVPTIDDGGFYLVESRAIMQYFANAYSKNDSFYPRPAKQRAIVDQMLQFDMGTLYKSFADAYYPTAFAKQKMDPEKIKIVDTNLGYLEDILDRFKYAAGDEMTIADFAIMASLATFEACGHNLDKFSLVNAYYHKCKREIKNHKELNEDGANMFTPLMKAAN